MTHDSALRALAERLGVLSSYLSQDGSEVRSTSDETRVAILAAMGHDASSESRARELLEELARRDAERMADPVRVVRERELAGAGSGGLRFRVPDSWGVRAGERVEYALEVVEEDGRDSPVVRAASEDGSEDGSVDDGGGFTASLPRPPAPGYYDLRVTIRARDRSGEARQRLIVVPERCVMPERRGYGVIANLYSVRGARSWGVGDLTDLAELARWSGAHGAAFVGVNPLHALRSVGGEVSPYAPVSRLYRNPAYLDVEAIPELAVCAEALALLRNDSVRTELARIRSGERVEYEARVRVARPILQALHRCFVEEGRSGSASGTGAPADVARRKAYDEYRKREGQALDDFAVFTALDEHFARGNGAPLSWQQWPGGYHSPRSPAVAEFARAHELEVDFHRWLQFELDRQLGAAALAGRGAGLSIGLYQDLAVASAPYGSDVWARAAVHASGVSIGAPPDDYSATGQNWGLTPLDPHRLRDDGYRFWTALVRSALRHAGALRIDHILGAFRQFWIPAGMDGSAGVYVRFPTTDLLGILALESARHGAVIVGEDLGTVPAEVPGTLREWGILGTRVMLFERERDGAFRPASTYEPLSLATADTHDLPTLAGFWEGNDVALAARLGRFANADAERAALRTRQNDRRLLTQRLSADGALPPAGAGGPEGSGTKAPEAKAPDAVSLLDPAALASAVHRFLCSSPAVLVGISLDDVAGETEPVNVPGVSAERFASWTRRMRKPLADIVNRAGAIPPDGCEGRVS